MAKNGRYNFFRRLGPPENSGFILIEVLVSLVLVYLISGLVLNVITVGTASLGSSGHQTLACAYGASLLEEMKAYPERFRDVSIDKTIDGFYRKVYGIPYGKVTRIAN